MTTITTTTERWSDLVPAETRRGWAECGWYADQDLYALFARRAAEHPDRVAVIDANGQVDYAELDRLVLALAAGLRALGVTAGEVVGIQLPNDRISCAVELAVAAIGATALPFPVGRGERDIVGLLGRAGACVAVSATSYGGFPCAGTTLEHAARIPTLRAVVAVGEQAPMGCVPLELLLAARPDESASARPDPNGPARILVSSGSEAEPKMIVYSHNALAGGRGGFIKALAHDTHAPRVMFLVPLGSAFGSSATSAVLTANGGTLIVAPRFDPAVALRMIAQARPTHVMAVPTMLRKMLAEPTAADTDFSSVEAFVLGGSSLDAATAAQIVARTGRHVVNLYGSADGVNSHTAAADPIELVTSAGRPNPAVAEIRVVDDELHQVETGKVGEIIALGPMTPMRYVDAPELDARYRLPGGWVRTGDLGTYDAEGYLRIVGRRKDVIIRGGANISPAEVEALLFTHPAVLDAACVAVPDPEYGERMCACIASRGAPTLAELCRFLEKQGLERHKLPERLLVLASLPVGPTGKVDRLALQLSARQLSARK